jgi:hypothetical protein
MTAQGMFGQCIKLSYRDSSTHVFLSQIGFIGKLNDLLPPPNFTAAVFMLAQEGVFQFYRPLCLPAPL